MDYAVGAIEPEDSPGHGDLSVIQMKAAMEVWLYQPMSLGELARRLKVSPSSASALVDKLVEKEVVTREPDPEDRRRVVLCIHPQAAESMVACNRRFHEAFSAIAGKVGDAHVDKWYDVMIQIRKILDEEVKNG
ncbi:MAG: MarR family transcriptional regulator [Verrucomicrobia bacterium]|nr:MarR family transcriptional regulator [Verrucomicrobiota bacterium]